MVKFYDWLSDPVRVLRTLNAIIIFICLLAGLFLHNRVAGLAFALLGTIGVIQLRILNH